MKIVTLCGCGLGTCFILKFTAEKAARELGLKASVVPSDIGSCALEKADLFLAPFGLDSPPGMGKNIEIIAIRNIVSVPEVKSAIEKALMRR